MGKPKDTRKKFKTRWYHRHPKYWFRKDRPRPAGHRTEPEVVRIDPEPGVAPSPKPPVRIFLGTEPLQARAERVFVWSVLKQRDPARAYEIHLMKDLVGFDRTGWTTGFTNYRFAIPALARSEGRGIYNDVDQIYLADPSELFDLEMGDASVLCIEEDETSVALIDAARMAPHWRVQDAQQAGMKRDFFLGIMNGRGLFGRMDEQWNARDNAFTADRSKCFHFTTLRTQPWRPFPDQLRYEPHPEGEVWYALEREADAARFTSFTRKRPGSGFAAAVARLSNGAPAAAGSERRHQSEVAKLIGATGAKTVLDYSAPAAEGARSFKGVATSGRPDGAPFAAPVAGSFDGVVSIDLLTGVPEEDAPWILDELFAAARRFVYVAVAIDPSRTVAGAAPLPSDWWRLQMELAANRNPGLKWALLTVEGAGLSASTQLHAGAPRVTAAAA